MYCDHKKYLQKTIDRMYLAKHPNEITEIINKIDQYITNHESHQLDLLKDLALLSKTVYGFDKTIEKYSENIELFQSFFNTKNKLNEQLIEHEKSIECAQNLKNPEEDSILLKYEIQAPNAIHQLNSSLQAANDSSTSLKTFIHQESNHELIDVNVIESERTYQTSVKEEPPKFIQKLSDATVQEGKKHKFQCTFTASKPYTIVWLKDEIPIANYPHYVVCNENDLCTLSIDETEDSAIFTCRITNHFGFTETSARLFIQLNEQTEIIYPPHFTKPLKNTIANAGSSVYWNCFVEGNPLPTIQWYRNNVCIDLQPHYNISFNNGEAILRLDDLSADDEGFYTLVAKNKLGCDQCSATLTITYAQSIDSCSKNGLFHFLLFRYFYACYRMLVIALLLLKHITLVGRNP